MAPPTGSGYDCWGARRARTGRRRPPREQGTSRRPGRAMKDLKPKQCARILRVLAEPERLRIIQCLSGGPKNVSEIAQLLGRHVVKVSHHLSVLRQAGLVD